MYYTCWAVGTLIASGVCYGVRSPLFISRVDAEHYTDSTVDGQLVMEDTVSSPSGSFTLLHPYLALYS
jgi:hypothetical protein